MRSFSKLSASIGALAASIWTHVATAGYGGMGNVETDGSDPSLSGLVVGGLFVGAIIWLWKKFF